MELVMLIGIPGSGKSSFYREKYFNTSMRVSLDLFNTRNKANQFLSLGFALHQRMVVDNTNVTKKERSFYIQEAIENKFRIVGYYFESKLKDCIERNENRGSHEQIPKVGVIAKFKELELPALSEGFDELYYVRLDNGKFKIEGWVNEI